MAKVNLMTQAEYAKHRGCSAVAVHKAVKAGRISLVTDRADGKDKIDPAVADIQWAQNSRARAVSRAPEPVAQAPAASSPGDVDTPQLPLQPDQADGGEQASGESITGDPQYQASRSSREEAEARRSWLKLKEEEGELVRIDQVRAQLASKLSPVREAFLQLPARLASTLASQSDPARIQTLLEAEIHKILAPLGKQGQSEGGTAA